MKVNREALITTGDTTTDKIFAHYIDEKKYPLSAKQEEIRDRWLAAWTLRLGFRSAEQAVNIYKKRFNLSRAQAFRDLKRAEKLFGSLSKTDREAKRSIWAEYVHRFFIDLHKKNKILKQWVKHLN